MKASEVIKEMQEKSKISRINLIMEQKKKDDEELKKLLKELNKPVKPGAIFL